MNRVRQKSTRLYWSGYALRESLEEDEIPHPTYGREPPLRKGERDADPLRRISNCTYLIALRMETAALLMAKV